MEPSGVTNSCLASFAVLAVAGCGTAQSFHSAREQTIVLDWHEASGPPGNRLIVRARRFTVRRNSWAVSAAVKNDSRATLVISRRHRRHGTECGILLLGSASPRAIRMAGPGRFASRFTPRLPIRLVPGASWSGTFSGPGQLPVGKYVRIELGSFGASGTVRPPISMQFEYITKHVFRLPGGD
jgi:hypothetical protein